MPRITYLLGASNTSFLPLVLPGSWCFHCRVLPLVLPGFCHVGMQGRKTSAPVDDRKDWPTWISAWVAGPSGSAGRPAVRGWRLQLPEHELRGAATGQRCACRANAALVLSASGRTTDLHSQQIRWATCPFSGTIPGSGDTPLERTGLTQQCICIGRLVCPIQYQRFPFNAFERFPMGLNASQSI